MEDLGAHGTWRAKNGAGGGYIQSKKEEVPSISRPSLLPWHLNWILKHPARAFFSTPITPSSHTCRPFRYRTRRCPYRPWLVGHLAMLTCSHSPPLQRSVWGTVLAVTCWSPCAQRRCYPTGRCTHRPSVTSWSSKNLLLLLLLLLSLSTHLYALNYNEKMMALNRVFSIHVCSWCELIYMLRDIFEKVSAIVHLLYSVSPSTFTK